MAILTKHDALISLKPGEGFRWAGYDYKDLEWNGSSTKPTESEVNAKLTELTTQWEAKEYQHKRAGEYPSIEAQLDDIYHNGVDGWKATIKAVKDKYPKP